MPPSDAARLPVPCNFPVLAISLRPDNTSRDSIDRKPRVPILCLGYPAIAINNGRGAVDYMGPVKCNIVKAIHFLEYFWRAFLGGPSGAGFPSAANSTPERTAFYNGITGVGFKCPHWV